MPGRPSQKCTICGVICKKSRCDKCAARKRGEYNRTMNNRNRTEPNRAFYQTVEWRRISRDYIDRHPQCVMCGAPSKIADHYPLSRKQLISMGYFDTDSDARLRALCKSCNSKQTAERQPGGWNKQHHNDDDDSNGCVI